MSLCDKCYSPGACCKRMYLTGKKEDTEAWLQNPKVTDEDAHRWLRKFGLPFVSLGFNEEGRRAFMCPKLDAVTGRCTIYRTRPKLCRDYEAASDGLCVHFGGAEGTDQMGIDQS